MPKLEVFDCPGGQVAFALAGNSAFAWSAIQKLKARLEATPPGETITIAERVLEKEYRRHVLSHPDHALFRMLPSPIDFIPNIPMPCSTNFGSTWCRSCGSARP